MSCIDDGFLLQLEVSFVSMLLRLTQATGELGRLGILFFLITQCQKN